MLATWKVLVSLAVVPCLYLVYALIGTWIAYKYEIWYGYARFVPFVILSFLPSLGIAALKFGEAGMDVFK